MDVKRTTKFCDTQFMKSLVSTRWHLHSHNHIITQLHAPVSACGWSGACRADPVEPLFGTLVWAVWRSLRLTFRKVLTSAENKKLFLTTMVQLITTATARQTDPALLRECLNIVRLWLLEPENGGEHFCQLHDDQGHM